MKTLKIENTKPIQENFLGNNAVYHGYAGMPDDADRVYSEELCDLEADRAAALGLKIARTYYKWYAYDFEKGVWDWDNEQSKIFYNWAKRLKDRGVDIAINAGWCSPGDIMSTSWGGKSPFTVEGDWKASVANYAKWVSEIVHQLVEVRGLTNIKYLVMFTEPRYGSGLLEGQDPFDAWYEATKAADEQLKKDGRRHLVKLVGPNESGSDNGPVTEMIQKIKKIDPDLLDVYSSHHYLTNFISKRESKHGGLFVMSKLPGSRIQQAVTLKPNTEYEMKATLSLECKDSLTVSGNVLMGVYKPYFNPNVKYTRMTEGLFSAGGDATSRLNRNSSYMIDASRLTYDWKEFSFKFKTGEDAKDALVGVFYDVKQDGASFYIENVSLKEVGTEKELVKNGNFEVDKYWRTFYAQVAYKSAYDLWTMWINDIKSSLDDDDDFWWDEYNTQPWYTLEEDMYEVPSHGTNLATARIAMMNGGLQSSILWSLFDQLWPNHHGSGGDHWCKGVHKCGIMPMLLDSKVPYPAYYAVQLTGYVGGGEGTKVYKGTTDDYILGTLTVTPDGTFTVLAENDNETESEVKITFENKVGKTLYRYLYDPATVKPDENATPIGVDKVFENVETEIVDNLPAGAVVVYTDKKRW